ncbi:MAG: hypothetical protein C4523_19515 [Myxococcales bacterium]|nr:MAG: hypothetical protein C4523_19515 [Myxococcales bacterium]
MATVMKGLTIGSALLLFAACTSESTSSEAKSCATHADCPINWVCVDYVCQQPSSNTDGDASADGDLPDGDPPDGDSDSPLPDGDGLADGDQESDEPIVPQSCDPSCDYMNYQYCDEGSQTCATLACTQCYEEADCPEGLRCLNIRFLDPAQTEALICVKAGCEDDAFCGEGYFCEDYVCRPKAFCEIDTANRTLDQPCPFGEINIDGVACRGATSCIGLGPNPQWSCTTDEDCLGQAPNPGPDCVNGACGYSSCMGRCEEGGTCDAQHTPIDVGETCVCMLGAGFQNFGEVCSSGGVHADAGACAPDLACIVTQENPQATCSAPADCEGTIEAPWTDAEADCVGGLCRFSVCAYGCENNQCPDGGSPQGSGEQCVCLP